MKKLINITLLASLLTLTAGAGLAVSPVQAQIDLGNYVPGEVLVKFKPGFGPDEIFLKAYAVESFDVISNNLFLLKANTYLLRDLSLYPGVEYAELNIILKAQSNDTFFSEQWGLHNNTQTSLTDLSNSFDSDIDAPEAWSISNGAAYSVALIDSGLNYHDDLVGNILPGYDFLDNDTTTNDLNGHGTRMAGIIGAVGNNGIGIAGVNWQAKIAPLKFLNAEGRGTVANAVKAIDYATSNGFKLINASWGAFIDQDHACLVNGLVGTNCALYEAIKRFGQVGGIFVAAAGNDGTDNNILPFYPASYDLDNIISVTGTTRADRKAVFANFGSIAVDLAAPSEAYTTTKDGWYGFESGTSVSAAFVTGAISLYQGLTEKNYSVVKATLINSIDPIATLKGITLSGGRLNLHKFLLEVPLDLLSIPRI